MVSSNQGNVARINNESEGSIYLYTGINKQCGGKSICAAFMIGVMCAAWEETNGLGNEWFGEVV